jgi:hypothetical protein
MWKFLPFSVIIYLVQVIIVNELMGFTGFLKAVTNLVIASLPSVVGKTSWWANLPIYDSSP